MNRVKTLALLALLSACKQDVDQETPTPCNDADRDGVCDTDDLCPGSDDAVDADDDGLPDDCDACPADASDDVDSDGDGVCDSTDPCPLDEADDSDEDGVCDSDDLCAGFDDASDFDDDGLPDHCDPCPWVEGEDSDGDGTCDALDACPDDAPDDTDADGVCDSWDVCPGYDDDADADLDGVPDGCVCGVLDVAAPVGVPAVGGFAAIGVSLKAIIGGSTFEDFGDEGGAKSATFGFEIHDGVGFVCSIWWDISEPGVATPSNGDWIQQAPVTLHGAWDLSLSNGQTDCKDPIAVYYMQEVELMANRIGIGPMYDLEALLRQDPVVNANWDTDWAPYVSSLYYYVEGEDSGPPLEVSYVFQYDRTCETLKRDPHTLERVLLPKPTTGPLLEYYEAVPIPMN